MELISTDPEPNFELKVNALMEISAEPTNQRL